MASAQVQVSDASWSNAAKRLRLLDNKKKIKERERR
jgi:hypothetical protein